MTEFLLEAGTDLPLHRHPYEQTGCLVKGRLKMMIGSETFDAGPGDAWCIPENVDHGAYAVEDSVAIEVFAPVREDYLPNASAK
jgi:quercetin dioxygenase-like cupin family protein